MENMRIIHMNKYIVWISSNEAERFDADLVISLMDEVRFFLKGKQVKSYSKKSFEQYNPNWESLETT
jgi:hypothetical protein